MNNLCRLLQEPTFKRLKKPVKSEVLETGNNNPDGFRSRFLFPVEFDVAAFNAVEDFHLVA